MSTPPPITLYIYPGASSLFPHILFHYAGIDFRPQLGVPADPAFTAINPKKQVPALLLDGEILTENTAIAHAVNQLAPEKQIMGQNNKEFLRQCEWLNWVSATLHGQAWGPYVRPWRFTTDKDGEAAVKASGEARLLGLFDMIEERLDAHGPWTMGEHFTAIDAFLFHRYRTSKTRMKLENMEERWPRWTRVHDRVDAMEACQKALQIEDEMRTYAPPFS